MELFRMNARINIVHIAYKGIAPALLDLVGGRIEAMFSTVPSVLPSVRRGKVRALGVTSLQRDVDLPDVPTIDESAVPGFEVVSWQGMCTPSGVPAPVLARLRAVLAAVLEQPEVRKRLIDQGFQPHVMSADKFAAFVRSERAKWAKVVKEIGIQLQ
jgi:tripartite-type tricarboxylate transporter receptor subunit TctC